MDFRFHRIRSQNILAVFLRCGNTTYVLGSGIAKKSPVIYVHVMGLEHMCQTS